MPIRPIAFCAFLSSAILAIGSRSFAAETAALSNLSVRTTMAANQTLIVGGVVSGGAKNILVRAAGPALTKFGLSGMSDPRLALFTTGSSPIATNDNWAEPLASTFTAVGAFGFDASSKDAALVQSLNGAFTVQATGDAAGTLLVEAYDVAGSFAARMINVSARNHVGTGADVLIAGFNISGSGTKMLLIRGVGPGLAAFGVTGTLADPQLRLFDSGGAVIASNDNWDSSLAPTMAGVGAFALPANSRDAAMTVRLSPGAYSVQVAGANGGTGDGIVEIYEISDPLAEARLARPAGVSLPPGFPRPSSFVRSSGTVRFKVIFVDFSDGVATLTPEQVLAFVTPGSEALWRAMSYGKLSLAFDSSFKWRRMSKPSTQYGWPSGTTVSHRAYVQEAVNLALADGVDFSSADSILVMANPDAQGITTGPAFLGGGVTASGKTFERAITSGRDLRGHDGKWFVHEGGHTMGLPDLYPNIALGTTQIFVGEFGLMGKTRAIAPEHFAWERWFLGWIDDDQVTCVTPGTTTVTLTPLETAGGHKMAVVPLSPTKAIAVEFRRAIGYDSALTRSGPLAYVVDTTLTNTFGPIQVLPINTADPVKISSVMSPGQSLTHQGVLVRYLSGSASAVTLEITRP